MRWLKTVAEEIYGLFVDDLAFTLAILAWLALAGVVLPFVPIAATWHAPALFLGCAGLLVFSVFRAARLVSAPPSPGMTDGDG